MSTKGQAGLGCLILFALPFWGSGLFSLFRAFQQLAEGPTDWQETAIWLLAGLVFTGVGLGIIALGRRGQAKAAENERLKQTYPDVPWMWRSDWICGRISGSDRWTMFVAWAWAVFWNLVSAPLVFIVPGEVFDKGNKLALLGLLFPVVGVGLFVWAVRATLRWRKFGSSTFEMTTRPGVVGGSLRGKIHSALRWAPDTGVLVQLNCICRVVRRGRDGSTTESILWQDDYVAGLERLEAGPRGITIPVEFQVPYDCRETTDENLDNRILWRVRATAAVSGIDYGTHFEVPVFKTEHSCAEPQPGRDFSSIRNDRVNTFDSSNANVRVRPSVLGGAEYYLGPARNPGAAVGMLVLTTLGAGAIYLQLHLLEVPLLFPIVTGLALVPFVLILADLLFRTTRVIIERGTVKVRNSVLGIGSTKQIPCVEITGVKLGSSLQQQPSATHAGRVYHDVEIHTKRGGRVKAGKYIRNKREAEWLAAEMKRQIEANQPQA